MSRHFVLLVFLVCNWWHQEGCMEEQVAPQEQTSRPKERSRQGHTHLVQHGDTLASIALKYDMNMKDLADMNKLNRFSNLRLGQVLNVVEPPVRVVAPRRKVSIPASKEREEAAKGKENATVKEGEKEKEKEKEPELDSEIPKQNAAAASNARRRLFLQFPKELQEPKEDVFKETVKYCHGQEHIMGTLTITHLRLIFEPSEADILVEKNGFLLYQLNIDTKEIFDCREETELGQFMTSEAYIQICVMGKGSNGRIIYFILGKHKVVALCEKLMGVVRERVSLTKSAPAKLPDTTATEQVATPSAPPPSYPPPAIPVPTVSPRESAQPALVGPLTPTTSTSTSTTTSATTSTPNSNESTNTKPKKDAKHHLWYLPSPLQDTSNLLSAEDVTNIQQFLPGRQRSTEWALLYSTFRHGCSLNTFFSKVREKGPTVIIVEDFKHYIFGAFASESWHVDERYFGTGNSFLFKLYPTQGFYLWTTHNSYFQLATEKTIAMGGGEGKVGLWLNEDFSAGSSSPCETFGNTCLAHAEEFEVLSVEVWGFPNSYEV